MVITYYLIFVMFAVLWFDITRYIIPNWLTGSLLVLYPIAVWMAPHEVDWQKALLGMLAVFVVGYFIFAKKWMGGGDVKLIIVCSLWVGLAHLLDFIFIFAVIGGLLSVFLFVIRKILLMYIKLKKQPPRLFREGEPVPYGIAIATAFLLIMSKGQIPAVSHVGFAF